MWPWIFMALFWVASIILMRRSNKRYMEIRERIIRLQLEAQEAERRAFYAAQGRYLIGIERER